MSETPAEKTARIDKLVKKHLERVAKGELPSSEFSDSYKGKLKSSLSALGGIMQIADVGLAVIGAPIFYLFILEESVQAAGFGVFTLIQGKLWREASVQNRRYRHVAAFLETHAEYIQDLFTVEGALSKTLDFFRVTDNPVVKVDVEAIIPDSVGKVGLSFLFEPFAVFARESLSSADAYDARIAAEIRKIKPDYKEALDEFKKKFSDDSFKLRLAHDERIDNLAVEKRQSLDQLSLEVKQELSKIAAEVRKKTMTRSEADNAKILISQERDKIEISIKEEFDEKQRAEKEVLYNSLLTLEKIHENQTVALREHFFQIELTDEEKTIYGEEKPPIQATPFPITIPEQPPSEVFPPPSHNLLG